MNVSMLLHKPSIGNLLQFVFVEILGISFWILLVVLFLENRIAFPVTGRNYNLDFVELWTIVLWSWARWGHFARNLIASVLEKTGVKY